MFRQFLAAAESGDRNGVVATADSLLAALRDVAKLTGELRTLSGITVNQNTLINNFVGSRQFAELSRGLIEISREFPAAKTAIIALLRRLDASESHASGLFAPVHADVAAGDGTAVHGLRMPHGGPVIEAEAIDVSVGDR